MPFAANRTEYAAFLAGLIPNLNEHEGLPQMDRESGKPAASLGLSTTHECHLPRTRRWLNS